MAKKIRGRNQGSIVKRGQRFRALISINGNRKSKSFDTKRDAQVWISEMSFKRDRGLVVPTSRVTVNSFLVDWLEKHTTQLKEASARRYNQVARDYVFPYVGRKQLSDFTVIHVEELYQQLLERGVSERNVRYVHSLLNRSLKDAVKRGYVGFNAASGARQPKNTPKEMMILDETQVIQFLSTIKSHRHQALFHVAIKTGMRQGEIFGLMWIDIDWQNGFLRVQRQAQRVKGVGKVFFPPKTKAGRRTIPLGDELIQLLQEHQEKQEALKAKIGCNWQEKNLVFPSKTGNPLSESNLLKEYKLLLEIAGLPEIRFHDLRHTAASIMLNRGITILVVSRILGHSKPSTTLDIYGHLIPVLHEGIGNQMDEWLKPIDTQIADNTDV